VIEFIGNSKALQLAAIRAAVSSHFGRLISLLAYFIGLTRFFEQIKLVVISSDS